MFIGRRTELNELNKLYNKTSFQMAVIYGRRRIGKTRLIPRVYERQVRCLYDSSRGRYSHKSGTS